MTNEKREMLELEKISEETSPPYSFYKKILETQTHLTELNKGAATFIVDALAQDTNSDFEIKNQIAMHLLNLVSSDDLNCPR